MNETDEPLEDITNLMERQLLENDHIILESSVCSSGTSQAISLTNADILGLLEALLCQKEYIQFNELIPDTYSAKDKTTAFHLLLELHAQRKIVLTQKDCHDTLWIWKYNIYD
ncbi:unnamed protein product [Lasius platythorax]|uniref:Uncharacterized protein n=1 Tax=Lasius platythorax TaxID=488582 RepID=A0AAV2MYK5_9HYME